jgi:hypothetical protein
MGLVRAIAWGVLFIVVGAIMIVLNGAFLGGAFAGLLDYYYEYHSIPPPHVFIEAGLLLLIPTVLFTVTECFILRRVINNLKQARRVNPSSG